MQKLKVTLDVWWDIPRQRRAMREFGRNFHGAATRRPGVVEHYPQ
jgi:Protein of unknown function (DUF2630)